jgi:uncharacterized protein YoxC
VSVHYGGIAALIAAVAFVGLVGALAVPLVKLGRTVDAATRAVNDITDRTGPLLDAVHTTVDGVNTTLVGVNQQLEKVDTLTDHVTTATASLARVSTVFGEAVAGPLVKVAAFSYGVRSAVSARRSSKLEREVRDELKNRRKKGA